MFAKIVNVEASEKIVITDSGNVTGDMSAPKVILKDGSYFKKHCFNDRHQSKHHANQH
ncbi:polymer-forming cytoskeletal protein [Isorropodon fossajaponicum symbiont]|uniref:polymer-forming cytoskeletal protein n=1 Tax=Isorropodon fossajaponicum symbiont TaxID=883811 RepID=UPI001916504F|nr:polymer-forming cytoskeletal protein [Isorropodon fossajaponicum symbiont]